MKLAILVSAAALAVSSTYASECTTSQLSAIENRPELTKFETACAGVDFSGSSYSGEAGVKKVCGEKECISALVAALKIFPDCTVQGTNPKTIYTTIEAGCKKVGMPISSSGSATSATSASSALSTTSTTVTAVAMAAAAVVFGRA